MNNKEEKTMNDTGETKTTSEHRAGARKVVKKAKRERARKTVAARGNDGGTAKEKKATTKTAVLVSAALQEQESVVAAEIEAAGTQEAISPVRGNGKSEEVVKFTLAKQRYGLPAHQIVEVLRMVAFTVLPEQPKGLLGVMNFRGEVIPLLDLRQIINIVPQHVTLSTPILVARVGERSLGLVVDEVLDVEVVPLGNQITVDELSTAVRFVAAIARREEGLLLVINLQEVLQAFPRVTLETILS